MSAAHGLLFLPSDLGDLRDSGRTCHSTGCVGREGHRDGGMYCFQKCVDTAELQLRVRRENTVCEVSMMCPKLCKHHHSAVQSLWSRDVLEKGACTMCKFLYMICCHNPAFLASCAGARVSREHVTGFKFQHAHPSIPLDCVKFDALCVSAGNINPRKQKLQPQAGCAHSAYLCRCSCTG